MNNFYSTQMEFIYWLQQFRSPFVDDFFKFLNFFDRPEFFYVLMPAVWVGYHWKEGMRIFYIGTLSAVVNYGLKNFFALPRPFAFDPNVALTHTNSYGLPSGGAQTALLFAGLLVYYVRKPWAWLIAANFFFWVSLSRLYLGAHFLTDVLGGWALGLALLAIFIYLRPSIEKTLQSFSKRNLLILSVAIPLLLLPFSRGKYCIPAVGVGIGLFLASRYRVFLPQAKKFKEFFPRALLGIGGTFAIAFFLRFRLPDLVFLTLGLWLSIGATLVWKQIK